MCGGDEGDNHNGERGGSVRIKGRTHAPSLSLMVFPLELPLSLTLSHPCYAIKL